MLRIAQVWPSQWLPERERRSTDKSNVSAEIGKLEIRKRRFRSWIFKTLGWNDLKIETNTWLAIIINTILSNLQASNIRYSNFTPGLVNSILCWCSSCLSLFDHKDPPQWPGLPQESGLPPATGFASQSSSQLFQADQAANCSWPEAWDKEDQDQSQPGQQWLWGTSSEGLHVWGCGCWTRDQVEVPVGWVHLCHSFEDWARHIRKGKALLEGAACEVFWLSWWR